MAEFFVSMKPPEDVRAAPYTAGPGDSWGGSVCLRSVDFRVEASCEVDAIASARAVLKSHFHWGHLAEVVTLINHGGDA